MTVSVVVPFRSDGAARDRNWSWLRERFPWEVVTADCDGGWNKPQAVNRAARKASGDILVVSDADVFVTPGALDAAIAQVRHHPWVVPHGQTRRLTPEASARVLEGADPRRLPTEHKPRTAGAGGGLLVVPADAFWAVGGMDEQFCGWGFEDVAFALVLDTLVGRHVRLTAPLFHLWHPPQARPKPPAGELPPNRVRYRSYVEARSSGRLADFVKERL